MFERVENAAQGRAGGGAGARGRVYLRSGQTLKGKGLQIIPAGEQLILETPGGGGYGDPADRSRSRVRDDLTFGLVSAEAAASDYGWKP